MISEAFAMAEAEQTNTGCKAESWMEEDVVARI